MHSWLSNWSWKVFRSQILRRASNWNHNIKSHTSSVMMWSVTSEIFSRGNKIPFKHSPASMCNSLDRISLLKTKKRWKPGSSSLVCLVNSGSVCSLTDGGTEGGQDRDVAVMEIKNVSFKYEIIVWAQTHTDVKVNRGRFYLVWEGFVQPRLVGQHIKCVSWKCVWVRMWENKSTIFWFIMMNWGMKNRVCAYEPRSRRT